MGQLSNKRPEPPKSLSNPECILIEGENIIPSSLNIPTTGISFKEACKRLSLLTTISTNTNTSIIKNNTVIRANSKHKNKYKKRRK